MTAIQFTAIVDDMFGNLSLEEMSNEELLSLLEETYDIPRECIQNVGVVR